MISSAISALALAALVAGCSSSSSHHTNSEGDDAPDLVFYLDSAPNTPTEPSRWEADAGSVHFYDDANIESYSAISFFEEEDALIFSLTKPSLVQTLNRHGDVVFNVISGDITSRVSLYDAVGPNTVVSTLEQYNAIGSGKVEFRGAEVTQLVSLDNLDGTLDVPAEISAGTGSYYFNDNANTPSVTTLIDFGADDTLNFSGVEPANIAVSSYSNNVEIHVNKDAVMSVVVIEGAAPNNTMVFDIESFNALGVGTITATDTAGASLFM